MHRKNHTQAFGPVIPRLRDVMAHIPRYSGRYIGELAYDAGLSVSTVARVINRKHNPSFLVVARVTEAIERKLGHRIDPRDLLAEDGEYVTKYVCDVVRCPGCLPEAAYDEFGDRKQSFASILPGQWVSSKYPNGIVKKGGA